LLFKYLNFHQNKNSSIRIIFKFFGNSFFLIAYILRLYRIDKTRVNEFGESFEDNLEADESRKLKDE